MARPRDPHIDRAVVDACVALLSEVGRSGLTRALIARRANVSLPAVNRRFASVDEILLQVASAPYAESDRAWSQALADPPDLRDFLLASSRRTAHRMRTVEIRRSSSELLAAAAGDAEIGAAVSASIEASRELGLACIERARSAGEIGADVDAQQLLDLLNGALYYQLIWRGRAPSDAEATRIVELILDGARPRD